MNCQRLTWTSGAGPILLLQCGTITVRSPVLEEIYPKGKKLVNKNLSNPRVTSTLRDLSTPQSFAMSALPYMPTYPYSSFPTTTMPTYGLPTTTMPTYSAPMYSAPVYSAPMYSAPTTQAVVHQEQVTVPQSYTTMVPQTSFQNKTIQVPVQSTVQVPRTYMESVPYTYQVPTTTYETQTIQVPKTIMVPQTVYETQTIHKSAMGRLVHIGLGS